MTSDEARSVIARHFIAQAADMAPGYGPEDADGFTPEIWSSVRKRVREFTPYPPYRDLQAAIATLTGERA